MSDLQKRLLKSNPALRGLPPRTPPHPSHHSDHSANKRQKPNKKDYTLLPWTNYFDRMQELTLDNGDKFRVYVKGDSGPVFFFLHGGGFSGLSWSLLSSNLVTKIKCRCYSLDIRGHGGSETNNDDDLSIETMSNDVKLIVEKIWGDEQPPIILVGHSMGGALAIHVANRNFIKNLMALVVIDVVEGSAMDALSSMQAFLQGRPKVFSSVDQAIEYHVRSGAIRNVESARVSIIGQLKKVLTDEKDAGREKNETSVFNIGNQSHAVMQTEIAEEDEDSAESEKANDDAKSTCSSSEFKQPNKVNEKYVWRIDLTKTEKFWNEWFKGLSNLFLNVHAPKLLLLAGVDRLDKDLMVGQMQGKFQMQILPQCGHAVHEDSPNEVADALSNFALRYKFVEEIGPISPAKLCC